MADEVKVVSMRLPTSVIERIAKHGGGSFSNGIRRLYHSEFGGPEYIDGRTSEARKKAVLGMVTEDMTLPRRAPTHERKPPPVVAKAIPRPAEPVQMKSISVRAPAGFVGKRR